MFLLSKMLIKGKYRDNYYLFSIAAVTNYHKHNGYKPHKFVILQFWMSEIWNQFHWAKVKVLAGLIPSWRFWEQNVSLLFAISVTSFLGLWFPSCHLKAHHSNFASVLISSPLSLTFLPSSYKDRCGCMKLIPILQDNLSTSRSLITLASSFCQVR